MFLLTEVVEKKIERLWQFPSKFHLVPTRFSFTFYFIILFMSSVYMSIKLKLNIYIWHLKLKSLLFRKNLGAVICCKLTSKMRLVILYVF